MSSDIDIRAREAFMAFDRDGDGSLSDAEFLNALRGVGVKIDRSQENDVLSKYGVKMGGSCKFQTLQKAASEMGSRQDPRQVLVDMFRPFDRENNGKVNTLELRQVMSSVGELLSEKERDNFMQVASAGPTVDYGRLADQLCTQ